VIGAVAGIVLFSGGEDDPESPAQPATPAAPPPPVVERALEPLGPDQGGSGTARIEGSGDDSRLILEVSGLPPREEAYAVWLYNSVGDAVQVDRAVGTALSVDQRLPADPVGYRYIDVSREPLDDNANHSGASVLRVPVAELTGGG